MAAKTKGGDGLTGEHGWGGEKVGMVEGNHGSVHDGCDKLLANG